MYKNSFYLSVFYILLITFSFNANSLNAQEKPDSYNQLVLLFKEWRNFESAPITLDAPDYTVAAFEKRWPIFKDLQIQLKKIDTSGWSIPNKVDFTIVSAEMNGFDFNYRILKPWARDPAFLMYHIHF